MQAACQQLITIENETNGFRMIAMRNTPSPKVDTVAIVQDNSMGLRGS